MALLRNLSIRTKATITIVLTSTIVLTMALSVVLARDYFTFREDELEKLTTLARIVSANSTAAVAFEDRESAREGLAKLTTDPNIKAAFIATDADIFASYLRSGESGAQAMLGALRAVGPQEKGIRGERNDMFVQVPISLDGETIATLYLLSDLSRIQTRLQEYLWLALGVLGSAVVVALLVSLLLGFVISKPLSYLSRTMRAIEKEKDYRQRMRKHGNDEMGNLIDSFNAMLEQIQLRDEKLSENRNDLEQQVKARTQELVQTNASLWQAVNDLEEAKSKAESANKAKSEFLATVSHEIRTPLNGILGTTEMLLNSGLVEKQRRFAQIVHGSAKSLLSIINTILDYSKIEAGKVELETVDFNPREIVEEVQDLFLEVADKKGLKYESVVDPKTPAIVRGDSGRLRQILTNLVGNALKFTEKGSISVRLQLQETSGSTVLLRFEVKDTGIGIDAAARDRIFESFAQADQSTTRRYGGTGLGLTIAKQLAQIMGGGIGLDSKVGQGTTFWFTVRLAMAGVSSAEEEKRRVLGGVRVLVVDGDGGARDALASQLAAFGIIATATGNLDEGLTLLQSAARSAKPFDVAFVDAGPGRAAARMVRAARAHPETQSSRIVLMGNVLGDQEMKDQGFPASCRTLLRPVRQSALFDCVADIVREKAETARAPRGGIALPATASTATATPAASVAPISMAPAAAPVGAGGGTGRRVLLAEDNPVNREVACEALLQLGLEVETANDGREAIGRWSAGNYDLILMDCHMPNMDGIDAAREIRSQERAKGISRTIPIVALTANVRGEDYDRCMAAGMNDYLTKPLTLKELGVALARWLGTDAVRSPVKAPAPVPTETAASMPAKTPAAAAPSQLLLSPTPEPSPQSLPAAASAFPSPAPSGPSPSTPMAGLLLSPTPEPGPQSLPAAGTASSSPASMPPISMEPLPAAPPQMAAPAIAPKAAPAAVNFTMVEDVETTGRALVPVPERSTAVVAVSAATVDAGTAAAEPIGAAAENRPGAEPPNAGADCLDMETIAYLRSLKRGEGPSVLERAIGVYLETAPAALDELRRCLLAGDASAVWRIAHSLKSSSASLGAKELAHQMSDIETQARQNDLGDAKARLERLELEFKKVSTALNTALREEQESCLKSA
jgi:signal transduction histidine kinase/DNA-binding response OmpR family regulator/HPt (histidine-containing phosphotransfer) domain-containing protein